MLNPITNYYVGQTQHELYVTYNRPLKSLYDNDMLYETCVWLGCEAAKGKSTEEEVFNAIWNKFQTMNVRTRDGRQLGYYSTVRTTSHSIAPSLITLDYMLKCNDGLIYLIMF